MNNIVKKTKPALLQCKISQSANFRYLQIFAICEFSQVAKGCEILQVAKFTLPVCKNLIKIVKINIENLQKIEN